MEQVFISSMQKELAAERRAVAGFVRNDTLRALVDSACERPSGFIWSQGGKRLINGSNGSLTPQVTHQVTPQVAQPSAGQGRAQGLGRAAGMADPRDREHFGSAYVDPSLEAGWIGRTILGKPTSRLQKYRITDKGRSWLRAAREGR